jgi:hypothetical protein
VLRFTTNQSRTVYHSVLCTLAAMKLGATSNSSAAAFAAGDVVDVTTGGTARKRGAVMMRNADGSYRVELDAGAGVLRSVPVGSLQLISSGADAEATSDDEGGNNTDSNTNSVIRLSPGRGGDSSAGGPTAAAAATSSGSSRYSAVLQRLQ